MQLFNLLRLFWLTEKNDEYFPAKCEKSFDSRWVGESLPSVVRLICSKTAFQVHIGQFTSQNFIVNFKPIDF